MRGLRLDPRQQLALFGVFVLVLISSLALPVADGVLAGAIVRLFGVSSHGVSVPLLVFANIAALGLLGGAVAGGTYGIRRHR